MMKKVRTLLIILYLYSLLFTFVLLINTSGLGIVFHLFALLTLPYFIFTIIKVYIRLYGNSYGIFKKFLIAFLSIFPILIVSIVLTTYLEGFFNSFKYDDEECINYGGSWNYRKKECDTSGLKEELEWRSSLSASLSNDTISERGRINIARSSSYLDLLEVYIGFPEFLIDTNTIINNNFDSISKVLFGYWEQTRVAYEVEDTLWCWAKPLYYTIDLEFDTNFCFNRNVKMKILSIPNLSSWHHWGLSEENYTELSLDTELCSQNLEIGDSMYSMPCKIVELNDSVLVLKRPYLGKDEVSNDMVYCKYIRK